MVRSLTNRKVYLAIVDVALINLAALLALYLRFEASVPEQYIEGFFRAAPVFTVVSIAVFLLLGLYSWILQYASLDELLAVASGSTVSACILAVATRSWAHQSYPRSALVLTGVFELILLGGFRISFRLGRRIVQRAKNIIQNGDCVRVLVAGAGDAGYILARELSQPTSRRRIVGFVDDDPRKEGSTIYGIKVYGKRDRIPELIRELSAQEIIIAMPSAPPKVAREIVDMCQGSGVRIRVLPRLFDMVGRTLEANMVRDIDIEDLLGRPEVMLDTEKIKFCLKGKRVLVTGAGGSIGSEICRQVARFEPAQLILLGHGENSVFTSRRTLDEYFPNLRVETIIADVRDALRVNDVFAMFRPEVIFHAAAHKHVPLMEENMTEAIKTNVFGTLNVARAALRYGADSFVMISTDKAVNPTSVMGVSKRVAEMVVQAVGSGSPKTKFVSVRFGNVLGSSGSVVPIFKEQIARGGPVTVTHPDMRRYFMTIREAVQLVLQAATMATGGEVFVLDMGEPVKIVDLAENMIRLSGRQPYTEIPIVFTGIRPGEKLFEELLTAEEGTSATHHTQIYVAKQKAVDRERFQEDLAALESLVFPLEFPVRLFGPLYLPGSRWPLEGSTADRTRVGREQVREILAVHRETASGLIGDSCEEKETTAVPQAEKPYSSEVSLRTRKREILATLKRLVPSYAVPQTAWEDDSGVRLGSA